MLTGSKTPRSTQKRVARMDKIMDDLRKEKKSMSPGQRTMVPGHRPLPGLGGANRLTPKAGMFGTAAGTQRSPASAFTPGGPRQPTAHRFQSPMATQVAQTAVSSTVTLRPPLSSESVKQNVSVSGSEHVSTSIHTSGGPHSGSTSGPISNTPSQTVSSNNFTTVATPSGSKSEDTKPAQAITVVQPTPGDGTPQRPALPKIKIRKDLIS